MIILNLDNESWGNFNKLGSQNIHAHTYNT
jgi:hypothetical protein